MQYFDFDKTLAVVQFISWRNVRTVLFVVFIVLNLTLVHVHKATCVRRHSYIGLCTSQHIVLVECTPAAFFALPVVRFEKKE